MDIGDKVKGQKNPPTKHLCTSGHRKLNLNAEHSPGNGNGGVLTGDQAVLLLGIDHGGVNCQRGTGVHYWPRPLGNKKNQ